jgi:dihydroorotate dehydrogenase
MYDIFRKFFFLFPPETAHYMAMDAISAAVSVPAAEKRIHQEFRYDDPVLKRNVFGLEFPNPVGLAAGFDKNAKYLSALNCLGFGFVEIGTVTPLPQPGNDKPRLFRLPADKALINRMGFNNEGVKAAAERLRKWKSHLHPGPQMIIGGNIGKNKQTPNEEAWKDYEKCFRELHDTVDYFVVNVSSPNTAGLRDLQEKESLRKILDHLLTINEQYSPARPILLKIAPDLNQAQLDDVISLCLDIRPHGLVISNTTIDRSGLSLISQQEAEKIGAGGLSGFPLKTKAHSVLSYVASNLNKEIPIVGSGGIFNGEDAYARMQAGADLVQVWTGFIYEGPSLAKEINKYLVARLREQGI